MDLGDRRGVKFLLGFFDISPYPPIPLSPSAHFLVENSERQVFLRLTSVRGRVPPFPIADGDRGIGG